MFTIELGITFFASYYLLFVFYLLTSLFLMVELDMGWKGFVPFLNLYLFFRNSKVGLAWFFLELVGLTLLLISFFGLAHNLLVTLLGVFFSLAFIAPFYTYFIALYPRDYFVFYLASLLALPLLYAFVVSESFVFLFSIFYVYLVYLRGDLFFSRAEPAWFFGFFTLLIALLLFVLSYVFELFSLAMFVNNFGISFLIYCALTVFISVLRLLTGLFRKQGFFVALGDALTYQVFMLAPAVILVVL